MSQPTSPSPATATAMEPPHPEQEYFAFLAAGRFMLQRSRGSGRHWFYPRVAEPRTGARDLEWVQASGRATVYATTVVHPKPPQPAFNVVLVELAEGPRLISRVEGIPPGDVKVGMALRARIAQADDRPLLVFDPAEPPQDGQNGQKGQAA